MRNMIVTHLSEITLRFERGKKAGLGGSVGGLYKRFAAPAALPVPNLRIY
jgi:hypothetical protein